MQAEQLLKKAVEVSAFSYSPYSNFKVGAALQAESGKIYFGTNVENASYGATFCAERSALGSAIADNAQKFTHLAVYINQPVLSVPCGICRQVLAEFSKNLIIFCASKQEWEQKKWQEYTLASLLPYSFHL